MKKNYLEWINSMVVDNITDSTHIKAVKKLLSDERGFSFTNIPTSSAARAALTVAGVEDYHGYDEDTDYFIECFTNLRAEQKETTISQKPHN